MMDQITFNNQFGTNYPKDGNVDIAFKVYNNAYNNPNNFCILGRSGTIENIVETINEQLTERQYVMVTDHKSTPNFYLVNQNRPGNILHVQPWNIGINDAWVIGGVNGRSTFNFAGLTGMHLTEFNEEYLQGTLPHPITATAREIIGLRGAGYVPHIVHGTLLFAPPADHALTNGFDFNAYNLLIGDDNNNAEVLLSQIFEYLQAPFGVVGR